MCTRKKLLTCYEQVLLTVLYFSKKNLAEMGIEVENHFFLYKFVLV